LFEPKATAKMHCSPQQDMMLFIKKPTVWRHKNFKKKKTHTQGKGTRGGEVGVISLTWGKSVLRTDVGTQGG